MATWGKKIGEKKIGGKKMVKKILVLGGGGDKKNWVKKIETAHDKKKWVKKIETAVYIR